MSAFRRFSLVSAADPSVRQDQHYIHILYNLPVPVNTNRPAPLRTFICLLLSDKKMVDFLYSMVYDVSERLYQRENWNNIGIPEFL